MSNVFLKLNSMIDDATGMLESCRKSFEENPDDFSTKLEMSSLEYHLEELQTQLHHEKLIRDKEVVELRLKGFRADQGRIPLYILSDVAKYLSGSLCSLAYRLSKGFDPRSRIPQNIVRALNLDLAGMAYGSTRLYFSGSLNPNLFGYSLTEDSLAKTFQLFSSQTSKQLTDSISDVGTRSARNINGLLKTLIKNDLEAEISWLDPNGQSHKWDGDSETVLALSNTLDCVTSNRVEPISINGELIGLNKRGHFEIVTPDKVTYRGRFPMEILSQVTNIRIGEMVFAQIEVENTVNQTTGYEKSTYTLISIQKGNGV